MLKRHGAMIATCSLLVGVAFAAGRFSNAPSEAGPSIPVAVKGHQPAGSDQPLRAWLARDDIVPAGVWLQSPLRAAQYHAMGINMFVGVNGQASSDDLARFKANDMIVIPIPNAQFPVAEQLDVAPAWLLHGDEPDNAQPQGPGKFGPCRPVASLVQDRDQLRQWDKRPTMSVFGRGVADLAWPGRGSCTGHSDSYYPGAIRAADIVSFDIYPVVQYGGRLELVAEGTRNLRRWMELSGERKPLWIFVEAAAIHGNKAPTPEQVRALIWLPIINGADGLVLFTYAVTPTGVVRREDELFAHPELVAAITGELRTLHGLAKVIKQGRRLDNVAAASPVPLSWRAIEADATYILAGSERGMPADASFHIPGLQGQVAEVVGENRHLPVIQGRFTDHFSGYGAHIYRIAEH